MLSNMLMKSSEFAIEVHMCACVFYMCMPMLLVRRGAGGDRCHRAILSGVFNNTAHRVNE